MEADGFAWWRQRLSHMARYFDAYRIDHILGFFRIWQIPTHAIDALLGQFEPQLALTWDEIGIGGAATYERLVSFARYSIVEVENLKLNHCRSVQAICERPRTLASFWRRLAACS